LAVDVVRRILSYATSQDRDLAHGLFFADGEADLMRAIVPSLDPFADAGIYSPFEIIRVGTGD
jgi:hypothetical protein